MDRVTHDDILYGRLTLWQPVDGPRAAMDTVLLAAWVRLRARRPRFVELGAAAGAVSLMLALRFPGPFTITGVELQPGLVRLAERNRAESGLEDRVSFLCGDLRDPALLPAESFDGLAVNPPYDAPVKAATEKPRGRLSAIPSRSIARQGATGPFPTNHGEVCCTLDDIASAASRLLKGHGRLFAVFRTDRLAAFVGSMLGHRLAPKRLLMVHPRRESPSNLFLIECVKGGGEGLTVAPPLIVMGKDGKYTPDLLRAYGPEGL
ncbi:MAG: methyltransferase domain-containing protein [Fretibacterium sp.]|nr:methyltransferase domain-containing protein [Fretibacterium sp.]